VTLAHREPPGPDATTFVGVLHARAELQPGALAFRMLVDGEDAARTVTYAELAERAHAVAARLRAAVAPGDPVLLLYPPGLDYVVGLLGCFCAGVVAVPAYPPRHDRHLARLRGIVADSGARVALTTDEWLDLIGQAGDVARALTWIGTDRLAPAPPGFTAHPAAAEDAAFVQYTSGSTTEPRGVVLTHANLLANCGAMRAATGATPASVGVTWLPPYHDMGLIGGILGPLSVGFPATILSPEAFLQRPARWLRAITRHSATVSGGPDFAYELCVRRVSREERRGLDLSRWATAFSGAERVRRATIDRFVETFGPCGFARQALKPCYGLAEATLCVSFARADEEPREATDAHGHAYVVCGPPVAETEVRVVDPATGAPRPAGEAGELWVRGPGVARGYWRKPAETAAVFAGRLAGDTVGAWLRTGDLGFLADGAVVVTGRRKDLIVLRGRNVHPEDVEPTVAHAHPALRPGGGAVFAVDADGEERLVVAQELRDPAAVAADPAHATEVVRAIREAVAREHELEVWAVVLLPPRSVPKTTSGKVQRQACRAAWQAGELPTVAADVLGRGEDRDAEGGPTELALTVARTMAELLDLETVGLHDDFFALGGQSLLATQLVARLSERLGRELPLRVAFEARTPAGLAAHLHAAERTSGPPPPAPLPAGETPPLSFSQERMWFVHRLAPDSSAYNVGGALVIEGPLQPRALRRAFDALLERHAVLRSAFPIVDGAPRPLVRPDARLDLPELDLSAAPDPLAAAQAEAARLLAQPFSLERAPLVRAALYRLAADRHVLAVSLHHIVADGWSLSVLLEELSRWHAAFAADGEAEAAAGDEIATATATATAPPAPALQYGDYAAWQRRWLSEERLDEQLAWWRERLAGAPALLALPTDRPRPDRTSNRGALVSVDLPGELVAGLRTLALRHDATLFMALLAGFQALLQRYARQDDVLVGCPIANRLHSASEGLVGTLVNTLVLRTDLSGDPPFAELLARVRETALGAYAHQDAPFEQVVEAVAPARTTRHAPLVQVMFDFQRVPLPEVAPGGLRLQPLVVDRGGAQFDLSLYILDAGRTHLLSLEYATDLFDRGTAEQLARHYVALLRAAVETPDRRLSALPLLTADERRVTLEGGTGPTVPVPATALVVPAFARQVARRAGQLALVAPDARLTYAELDRRAARLAQRLRALGAARGERVAVGLERRSELVVALLAALRTGAAYVPVDPHDPPQRIGVILEDARPRVLVTTRDLHARLPVADDVACLFLDDEEPGAFLSPPTAEAADAAPPLPEPPGPDDPAYVLFTSGSTGRPKGVQVPHGALANLLLTMRSRPGFRARQRLLAVTTVSFDIAALELFLPLVAGGTVELVERAVAVDGRALRRRLEASQPDVMQATPATWRMLVEAGWVGDGRLDVLCGGEALPRELADALLERARSVWNLYGPTETTIWSAVHRVGPGEGPVPIGLPVANTRFYVLDPHGEPVPRGVAGELCIGGLGVAQGYFGRPDLTAERFRPDPFDGAPGARHYRTGDAARQHADGLFEFLGRFDTQVKIRGFRVELGEIEVTLARHPAVREVAVVVRDDVPGGPTLVAYVVWRDDAGDGGDPEALRRFVRERLPEYMVPPFVVALAALPLTPNRKVDRQALPRPAADAAPARAPAPPADALERRLLRVWQDLLGRDEIGVEDDFFALGGHSLLAVRLFTRLADDLGVDLPLATLFEAPTVQRLAAVVRRVRPTRGRGRGSLPATVVPIRAADGWPPVFWLHTVGGGGLFRYRRLAELLGDEQPSFGLREPDEPCADIPSLATAHVAALRTLQPRGPYLLAGFCFGGTLAYEVARQLRQAGERVAFVGLVDSFPPNVPLSRATGLAWAARLVSRLPDLAAALVAGGPELRRTFARRQLRRLHWLAGRLLGGADRGPLRLTLDDVMDMNRYPEPFRDIARLHWRAMTEYVPGPCDVPLTLFRPGHRPGLPEDPDRGWGRLAPTRVVELPGVHGDLLAESRVALLADRVRACLAAALDAPERGAGPARAERGAAPAAEGLREHR
jgi:amino acid adenylation domain-containing protein